VELRGFEPLASAEGRARCDAALAVLHGLPPKRALDLTLGRRYFPRLMQRQRSNASPVSTRTAGLPVAAS
jgi:hypothetical protein